MVGPWLLSLQIFGVILRAVENAVDLNDLVRFINLEQRHIVSNQEFAISALAQYFIC